MLESLSSSLQKALDRLRGKGKLTEEDVQAAMREVRLALLAADVNVKVVRDFVEKVRERAVGQEVQRSLTPGQQVVKIVYEELTALMGGSQERLRMAPKPPTVVMLVGLQGAGKTTTAAKLALSFRQHQHRPLLVAADVYRPAAIHQLQVLGRQIDVPVFDLGTQADPVDIARRSLAEAARQGADVVILDTAGRLHVDDALMDELVRMRDAVGPQEILLVVDAMTGQDAVNVAKAFHDRLGITGVILTKMDGDTRGGAALTVRAVTGCPIKFLGTGEKVEPLEPFHPDRLASRILGMGDVLSLIEKAQQAVDAEKAKDLEEKLRRNEFTLDDFREMLRQVRNMGPLDQLLKLIPGVNRLKGIENIDWDDKRFRRIEAIISSMTPEERANPSIMNASRRRRVAQGSGVTVREVNQVLNQFSQMQQMMKRLGGLGRFGGRRSAMQAMKSLGGLGLPGTGIGGPAGFPGLAGVPGPESKRHHKKKKRR
jgi:signal recognition particle subunit SRP54